MTCSILVVEDEVDLLATLEFNLQRKGFQTIPATTGAGAIAAAQRDPKPALMLLDIMLPDISGLDVCRRLRESHIDIPTILVTARGEEADRVAGFEVGVDDYVVKPFSVRELILRVQAVLRRVDDANDTPGPKRTFAIGALRVDETTHRAFVKDVEVVLTALEFRLLSTFMARRGRVQTRETLLTDVWGLSPDLTTRTVDTHVKRLREKLGDAGAYIETLRGVGYRFRDDVRPEGGSEPGAELAKP
jgi:two-component system phosphate regulon response regulator PhoB